eukprot:scaffold6899_cov183-Amphora_coffeaeformis.AAC.29
MSPFNTNKADVEAPARSLGRWNPAQQKNSGEVCYGGGFRTEQAERKISSKDRSFLHGLWYGT